MEDKEPTLTQAEFEKKSQEYFEYVKQNQFPRMLNWVPENFRRYSRFALFSLNRHKPIDFYNKKYTRAYLPFTSRYHFWVTLFTIVFIGRTAMVLTFPVIFKDDQ